MKREPPTKKIFKAVKPSVRKTLSGVVAFNLLYFACISVNVALIAGLYLKFTTFGPLLLAYVTYILVLAPHEITGRSTWPWFSKNLPLLNVGRRYLNLRLVGNEALTKADEKTKSQFIFAVFPHGCNADYRILMDSQLEQVVPKSARHIRTLSATVLFRIPLLRELSLWTGCVDARRSVATKLLERGRCVLVLPGGMNEQIRTTFGQETVYLRKRLGFVKLALKHRVPLVPVYVFGCSDYYKTSSFAQSFRLWLVKNAGMAIPLCRGQWSLSTCPRQVDTTVVFGEPLSISCASPGAPTRDEVQAAHDEFCSRLTALFERHKNELGYGDRQLEII